MTKQFRNNCETKLRQLEPTNCITPWLIRQGKLQHLQNDAYLSKGRACINLLFAKAALLSRPISTGYNVQGKNGLNGSYWAFRGRIRLPGGVYDSLGAHETF